MPTVRRPSVPDAPHQPLEVEPAGPEPEPRGRRPKFTSRVRRGLKLAAWLLDCGFDDNKAPSYTLVRNWTAAEHKDYALAVEWMKSAAE